MPLYDFVCKDGHITESRQGYGCEAVPCPLCGHLAVRVEVNESQTVITETGAKPFRRAEVPLGERRKEKQFALYREAAAEMEYSHKRAEEAVGHEIVSNPVWMRARERAERIQAGKAPPVGIENLGRG